MKFWLLRIVGSVMVMVAPFVATVFRNVSVETNQFAGALMIVGLMTVLACGDKELK